MLLKAGSQGDYVKQLQSKLGLNADGDFGSHTEAAVKQWQAAHGLTADGIVGDDTWAALFLSAGGAAPVTPLHLDRLSGHIPDAVIAQIPDTAQRFGINNPFRLAHLLAQCAHESGKFAHTQENLNYSAERLTKIFPRRFPTLAAATPYSQKPEKIGNAIYALKNSGGEVIFN